MFVDVCEENAASELTIRRKIELLRKMLRPGTSCGPSHVVIAGDQPTFKILVELLRFEIWLSSWRAGTAPERRPDAPGDDQSVTDFKSLEVQVTQVQPQVVAMDVSISRSLPPGKAVSSCTVQGDVRRDGAR